MISILLPNLTGGGAERVMIDLAREFVRAGHEVEFVVMQAKGDLLFEAQKDFNVVDLNTSKTLQVPIRLAGYFRDQRPEVIIANMWPLTSASVVGRAFSRHPAKLLLVEHCHLSSQYESWGKLHAFLMGFSLCFTHRFADNVAAVSAGAAADIANLARLSESRVNVLHNPIPQEPAYTEEQRVAAEKAWNCSSGPRILTVGALKDQKNQQLLVRAFSGLGRSDARLMLLGQGENEASLRSLAGELGVGDRVIFAGFQSDPDPFYATADLFVLSSDYEGLPTVLIEALSFGLRVVSTNCPSGPEEILEHGRFGRLVPVGDVAELTAAMETALQEPVDHDALIHRAADFSPKIAARKYLELLDLT